MLVSAAIRYDSTPAISLRLALAKGTVLTSEALFTEVTNVFARPKLRRFLREDLTLPILADLRELTQMISVTSQVRECRDPKDDFLLALAADGRADYLVTGDDELLALDPWNDVRVLQAADLLTEFVSG